MGGIGMTVGEKEISIEDAEDAIKCSKRLLDHIRKKEEEEISSKNKTYAQEFKLSDKEKCYRTTLVRMGLLIFCSMGLEKYICECYDRIKEEGKKFGRKLTDDEIYKIVIGQLKCEVIYDD